VSERIARGLDITSATQPVDGKTGGEMAAMSNMLADRDEDFNTRYASYRGWQMAVERVKPIPRRTASLDLTAMVVGAGLRTTTEVVDHVGRRFLRLPLDPDVRARLVEFLDTELGTSQVSVAATYMEDALRMLVHLVMSTPEYQLG
jgi:hypothetical protein